MCVCRTLRRCLRDAPRGKFTQAVPPRSGRGSPVQMPLLSPSQLILMACHPHCRGAEGMPRSSSADRDALLLPFSLIIRPLHFDQQMLVDEKGKFNWKKKMGPTRRFHLLQGSRPPPGRPCRFIALHLQSARGQPGPNEFLEETR